MGMALTPSVIVDAPPLTSAFSTLLLTAKPFGGMAVTAHI
jgi:hypothetical protein